MSIVCGTDFSSMATNAVAVAASLAARLDEPLHLVHALERGPEATSEPGNPQLLAVQHQLACEAARARAMGARCTLHALAGPADEVIRGVARENSARLVIVGAHGESAAGSRGLGGRAELAAQHSHVPVLVIRNAAPFVAWLKEARTLRIVLGVDSSESAEHAARWVGQLCQLGPCELCLAHLYWPPEAHQRLGLGGSRSLVDPDPAIVETLTEQFSKLFDPLLGNQPRSIRVEPHLGRPGDGLAALAAEAEADLFVVGSHEQTRLARLWEGSVARQALAASTLSAACVPAPAEARALEVPRLRQVIAATDFSALGNGAIPLAYAASHEGGTVHLVHVLDPRRRPLDSYDVFAALPSESLADAARAAKANLLSLAPKNGGGVATEVHVIESAEPALAICQAAERLGADLICIGTHGRTGLAKAMIGSVAAGVLARTRRPVLIAQRPKP